MRASVEPRNTSPERLHTQLAAVQIGAVDVRYLELAARGGSQAPGYRYATGVIEIQSGHRIARAGNGWLFLESYGPTVRIELHDTVALGVSHVIGKDRGPTLLAGRLAQLLRQTVSVEQVVTEDEADRLPGNEIFSDQQ